MMLPKLANRIGQVFSRVGGCPSSGNVESSQPSQPDSPDTVDSLTGSLQSTSQPSLDPTASRESHTYPLHVFKQTVQEIHDGTSQAFDRTDEWTPMETAARVVNQIQRYESAAATFVTPQDRATGEMSLRVSLVPYPQPEHLASLLYPCLTLGVDGPFGGSEMEAKVDPASGELVESNLQQFGGWNVPSSGWLGWLGLRYDVNQVHAVRKHYRDNLGREHFFASEASFVHLNAPAPSDYSNTEIILDPKMNTVAILR